MEMRSGIQDKPILLGIVTLASKTGRYGGPMDSLRRQLEIVEDIGFKASMLAGFIKGDAPQGINSTETFQGREVHAILPKMGFFALHSFRLLGALNRAIRKADLVFISQSRELIPVSALAIARLHRRPVVLQPHGMLTSRTSAAHRAFDGLILRPLIGKKPVRIIALTAVEAKELQSWGCKLHFDIHILGNALPADIDHARVSGEVTEQEVLFLARLHKRKRVDTFLKAAEVAQGKGWGDRYVVVGPDEGDLAKVLEAAAHSGNLTYEGALGADEVTYRVAQSRVFALPSEREPWGNVLAIALALGKPVVVTESAALADAIREYGAGEVVPDGSPSDFAEAVHHLIIDRTAYQAAALGAQRFAAEFLTRSAQEDGLRQIFHGLTRPRP